MRALFASLIFVVACGPKVAPTGSAFDEDLESRKAEPTEKAPEPVRPEAPILKGVRTGTIERAHLLAVLDKGPGTFLRQLEVTPRMDGNRFVGWQLVQLLDPSSPLTGVDVAPQDVLLAINGKPLSRPDQLQMIWDSLRTANELRAQLWRGDGKLELAFAIEPPVDQSTIVTPPSSPRAAVAAPQPSPPAVPPPAGPPPSQTGKPDPAKLAPRSK